MHTALLRKYSQGIPLRAAASCCIAWPPGCSLSRHSRCQAALTSTRTSTLASIASQDGEFTGYEDIMLRYPKGANAVIECPGGPGLKILKVLESGAHDG